MSNLPDIPDVTPPLTVEVVSQVMPAKLKGSVTQDLVDKLNNIQENAFVAKTIRENFIGYTGVLNCGKFQIPEYLNAVKYISYKLLGATNQDAYIKTFPQRYIYLKAQGATPKEISSYVAGYNKGKLVNLIWEQTLVPTWVLNADVHQKAINVLADLMINGKSERTRVDAADSLLTHLDKPKEAGPLINIDMRENSGLNELKSLLSSVAKKQVDAIQNGVSTKEIAEQKLVQEVENVEEIN